MGSASVVTKGQKVTAKQPKVFRGDRMRAVRERRDLSQEQLAERIGSQAPQISRYERGAVEPSSFLMARIAKELQVTVDYLLGLVDDYDGHLEFDDLSVEEMDFIRALRSTKTFKRE